MLDQRIESQWGLKSTDPKRLTKYERASAIGRRARMIGAGAPALVDVTDLDDPLDMATRELYLGKNPLTLRRYLPGHTPENPRYAEIRVSQLAID